VGALVRTLGRIALGASIGLGIAVVELILLIIVTEWAISHGWLDIYDDAVVALFAMCVLIAAPIIGGWKAWTSGKESR
jgi:hypothetical protein